MKKNKKMSRDSLEVEQEPPLKPKHSWVFAEKKERGGWVVVAVLKFLEVGVKVR